MPNLPWPAHRDEPVTGDPSLADLLTWAEFPPGSAPELKPVAEVVAALTAGPADDELGGEAAALAAYRNRGDVPRPATRARRRRRPLFPFLSARATATVAAAGAVLGIGAFATAAYTQALPAPVQRLAHVIIGAPAAGGGPPRARPRPARAHPARARLARTAEPAGPGERQPAGHTRPPPRTPPASRPRMAPASRAPSPRHKTPVHRHRPRARASRARTPLTQRQREREREGEGEQRQHADPAALTRRSPNPARPDG